MAKMPRINVRIRKKKHTSPGAQPGSINIPTDALKPQLKCITYNPDSYEEKTFHTIDELLKWYNANTDKVKWIDIRGFGDRIFFEKLAMHFNFHRLEMEDVFNVYQRPKAEEYEGHLFFTSRHLQLSEEGLINDQLNVFLGNNYVITVQEKYEDKLDPIRFRIKNSKGNLRHALADYLAYAIMDAVIDYYYPALEKIGDRMDELEDELLSNPTRESMNKILQIKRELIIFRRTVWSERDKVNDILRSDFKHITQNSKVYFRDSYDHCVQLLDIIDSYKEITASLMDVYLSSVSNKLNGVMKVLTIISTIFIPLTFIVGVYGMNFSYTDPDTGEILKWNMPELYHPYGYPIIVTIMLVLVIFQLYFFYKKGWLSFKNN
ncbi:MAG: magnesium/cobalt transporter CorA [Bacteroidetes bacterium]|nr:magnesium/cobalt transporter CorA [Bacteroidota bacterium]